jgi:hypothetical protein
MASERDFRPQVAEFAGDIGISIVTSVTTASVALVSARLLGVQVENLGSSRNTVEILVDGTSVRIAAVPADSGRDLHFMGRSRKTGATGYVEFKRLDASVEDLVYTLLFKA